MKKLYPTFRLTGALTHEQKTFFNENGFLHFENFLSNEAVQSVIDASKEVEQMWIQNKIDKVNGVPLKFGKDINGSEIIQRFSFISLHSPTISELIRDPRLDNLLPLLDGDSRIGEVEKDGVVLNHYINSEESKFSQMGWHTDGLRDLFYGGKLKPMINVGIHLNTLTEEHGGLRIIPGSHNQGLFDMLFRKKYFLDTRPDKNEIAIIPKAGDLTIHDGRLWHRVAQSKVLGEASRRRVIYFPIVNGRFEPKNENSPTLFYQRFSGLVG